MNCLKLLLVPVAMAALANPLLAQDRPERFEPEYSKIWDITSHAVENPNPKVTKALEVFKGRFKDLGEYKLRCRTIKQRLRPKGLTITVEYFLEMRKDPHNTYYLSNTGEDWSDVYLWIWDLDKQNGEKYSL